MRFASKHFFTVILSVMMLLSMAACGTTVPTPDANPSVSDTTPPESDVTAPESAAAPVESATDPVESDETPETAEPEPEHIPDPDYKYIVIVGVDGAGAYFKDTDTPNLDEIFANGAVTYEAVTVKPPISAQSWASMFYGVAPEYHGITNNRAETTPIPTDFLFPSVFRVIREQIPDAHLASFCNWSAVNIGIIEDGIGVHKVNIPNDLEVIRAAGNYVRASVADGTGAPTLMYLHLDEADAVGHSEKFGSFAQLEKITEQDSWIRELYDTYAELDLLKDTLFIVTADHGGQSTAHGDVGMAFSNDEMSIMFAAAGHTVVNGTVGEMDIRDIASIVLHALDLKQPEIWTARVPSGLFDGIEAVERPYYVFPDGERAHENIPTPEPGSAKHISNFITDKTLRTYLTFDGDVSDQCGADITSTGNIYFVEGYFGEGAALPEGYVSIPDYMPGIDSFSVSLWINTKAITYDPPLFSNKNWFNGSAKGYVMAITDGTVTFNAGDSHNRMDCTANLPSDFKTGWLHITLVVDRDAGEVKISFDFGEFQTFEIPDILKDVPFNASRVLNIGQDGKGKYTANLSATVDEFMLFDGAFTNDDLAKLAQYYGK